MATIQFVGELVSYEAPVESNGYTRRNFIVVERNQRDSRYDNYYSMELFGDKCALVEQFKIGEQIEVCADVRGRFFDKKDGSGKGVFTSLSAYIVRTPQPRQSSYPQQGPVIPGAQTSRAGYEQMQGQGQQYNDKLDF